MIPVYEVGHDKRLAHLLCAYQEGLKTLHAHSWVIEAYRLRLSVFKQRDRDFYDWLLPPS